LKFPDDIRELVKRKFKNNHREWLRMSVSEDLQTIWPLEFYLGIPTEKDAIQQQEGVRAWISAWKSWRGNGELVWTERHWRSLGVQAVPQKLIFNGSADAVSWIGEAEAWSHVFIVENLQTGLAFEDLAGSVVIMALGYGVDVLNPIRWLHHARCIYWGDIDTHGFAILNRARTYLPSLETTLMDKQTLFAHRDLWVQEKDQSGSSELPLLTNEEQEIFLSLKNNTWGQQVRLEQERICWDTAWEAIQAIQRR